ncbi:hypothetical protein BJX63DRAFT_440638 [Aspergillus granulosus]|uniref:Subtilisin-like serine protease n=1 Tax=Aspergillus granulosus TaxID=176169 RepID=A0ABR4GW92_9EURO
MAWKPPFVSDFASCTESSEEPVLLLPAAFRDSSSHAQRCPSDDIFGFLAQDLSVERLDKIHDWLWITGRPLPPRPLTFQTAVAREIVLDERADMHLVWERSRKMHFKPLPHYLLSRDFWGHHICRNTEIYRNALGLLYSYIALIQHESDFKIAKSNGLIPDSLSWHKWTLLTQQTLTSLPSGTLTCPANLNLTPRYHFGELRLSRLNLIYRLRGYYVRGYERQYQTYGELFTAYIAPLSVTTVYFVLALTAMQVGLATGYLERSEAFQAVSWGFAVVSIIAPLVLVLLLMVVSLVVFAVNSWRALSSERERLRAIAVRSESGS